MNAIPERVRIWEVGPRDGLQNEDAPISTEDKVAFIDALSATGLTHIEVTAFVNPAKIPQLADAEAVCGAIARAPGVTYGALVPNERGYARAVGDARLRDIAVFLSASETHNQRNIGSSVSDSLARYREICAQAARDGVTVRGYVSTAFGCPYEGVVPMERVVSVASSLLDAGCAQISLGDTTGMGNPVQVGATVRALNAGDRVALHLHDTRGTGLANALAGLNEGVRTFDASAGGIGGCPYAPGATGNVATDELIYMLHEMGIATGIDLDALLDAIAVVEPALVREVPSRYKKATLATRARASD